jgi:hypothetical protein
VETLHRVQIKRLLAGVISVTVCSCTTVGPLSIETGRTTYNEVIQQTAEQQTLLNIVRVSNHESPLFMDVSEVDAATTLVGGVSGGESGIGALANPKSTTAPVGAVTGTVSYSEAPTVRYLPLSGQPLIQQISTPIRVDSLVNAFNSDWPLATILSFGVDRITPNYLDYYPAVNALVELDDYGALVLSATKKTQKASDTQRTAGRIA